MLAQHSSETNEAYTPCIIVDPARVTMGSIDTDPASCPLAQDIVRARQWYGIESDGLRQGWSGNVLCNPPGGLLDVNTLQALPRNEKGKQAGRGVSSAAVWWARLLRGYDVGELTQAIFVCFTMAVFRTVQSEALTKIMGGKVLPPFMFPFCIPSKRVNYDKAVWVPTENPTPQDGYWDRIPTKGAPSDTCIVYLPDRSNPESSLLRFHKAFGHLGRVRT